MKRLIIIPILLLIGLLLMGASCAAPAAPVAGIVHMHQRVFNQASVTIPKGTSLTLVADDASPHVILSGSWINGVPQQMGQPGVPTVNFRSQGNDSHTIGLFNVAGTFYIYCAIHPGMNLTIVVSP
jgi:plastocyanin